MKTSILYLVAILGALAFDSMSQAQKTITFEELAVGSNGYYNGSDGAGGWISQGVSFRNSYNPAWGSWSGWAYSNVSDPVTPGFGNQYASFAGGGSNGVGGAAIGQKYAIATGTNAWFNLPSISLLRSVDITNTTYTALSMKHGDQFAKKFGGTSGNDPDFFEVTLRGYDGLGGAGNTTGAVTVALADFRFANNLDDYILNRWLTVDLSTLSESRSVKLEFRSSDVGQWGINTPLYVAMDNITFTAVPEPTSFVLCIAIAGAGLGWRRMNRITVHANS
jgi:hypothetical protein